ncbi:uncharacterized protein LAESUDRAFT_712962 [Laetiporus sulphureus 93-53]|uniref:Zn(2)-C6 fungal-type domain-containing protein n=1 Tax=Laetiporus sulphureus 93-53 TaxID=1314785 RepID=A0A165F626_9APHY|nr:uncharacterized protein LAESUDRAFT_712962 [Laetiporus sulphureus 93-53]KZT08464.1 hypothetical protein LAESUDRAFT_712962 [Laetiporus sulphureus 93-53]
MQSCLNYDHATQIFLDSACQRCRKLKAKCVVLLPRDIKCARCVQDLAGMWSNVVGVAYSYFISVMSKRGPRKGYLREIENRLRRVEGLLTQIMTSQDPHAKELMVTLWNDPSARIVLSEVDSGPFGHTGKQLPEARTTKSQLLAPFYMEERPDKGWRVDFELTERANDKADIAAAQQQENTPLQFTSTFSSNAHFLLAPKKASSLGRLYSLHRPGPTDRESRIKQGTSPQESGALMERVDSPGVTPNEQLARASSVTSSKKRAIEDRSGSDNQHQTAKRIKMTHHTDQNFGHYSSSASLAGNGTSTPLAHRVLFPIEARGESRYVVSRSYAEGPSVRLGMQNMRLIRWALRLFTISASS